MADLEPEPVPARFGRSYVDKDPYWLHDHSVDIGAVKYDPQARRWDVPYASYVEPGSGCAGCRAWHPLIS